MSDDAVKLSQSAAKSLFGLDGTKNGNPDKSIDSTRAMQRFSPSEVTAYSKALYVAPEVKSPSIQGSGIISYLKPVHQDAGNKRVLVEKMKMLAPEIEQSRILVSSSILSPNDLQDGVFTFSFENIPAINQDPHLIDVVSDVFNQFFNGLLELGIKSYDWIGEIQYGGGSKPLLILPIATQLELRNRTNKDILQEMKDDSVVYPFATPTPRQNTAGNESFEVFMERRSRDDDYLYSGKAGKACTWENIFAKSNPRMELEEMVPSMESFGVRVPTPYKQDTNRQIDDGLYKEAYIHGLEDMIVNLKTRLQEGDVIKVSENPEILRFATEHKYKTQKEMMDKLKHKYSEKDEKLREFIVPEEIVSLKSNPDNYEHQGHPTVIELPAESVIPIHIPGSPSEHLGYFILLDQYGQPLTIENSGMLKDDPSASTGNQTNSAYDAIFGSGCCGQHFFNQKGAVDAAGNMIFSHMLDKYLRSRISGVFGRGDLSIARFNAISSTLFYRLLERKNTTLVFVPPELLHYLAFAYDKKTGVGISKLDDIQFLLSLRTTYLVANIIAMANDAVQQKIVNVGVDDKNANIEAILDQVAQVFIAKQKVNGSIDPSEIIRDIYSNSLCIVPKNVPGLSDFSVDFTTSSNQSTRVDNDLIEQLTNLLVSHLDVPPSALNQLSEPEYAKSLVTYNLFFAKKITRYQRIWCSLIQEFIRDYAIFSVPFQKALTKVLVGNVRTSSTPQSRISKDSKSKVVKQSNIPEIKEHTDKSLVSKSKDRLPSEAQQLASSNPNVYSEPQVSELVKAIIEGVVVKLPSPNIVVDTAQFEQIKEYTSNLNDLADLYFPQDIVPSADDKASNAINVVKAMWKREQLARYLGTIGNYAMTDIPDEDEINPDKATSFIQMLQNYSNALEQQRAAINAVEEDDSMNGGGDSSFSGGTDFGGGSDDDMGFGSTMQSELYSPQEDTTDRVEEEHKEVSVKKTDKSQRGQATLMTSYLSSIYSPHSKK